LSAAAFQRQPNQAGVGAWPGTRSLPSPSSATVDGKFDQAAPGPAHPEESRGTMPVVPACVNVAGIRDFSSALSDLASPPQRPGPFARR